MAHSKFLSFFLFGLLLVLLAGCAYPISKELRQEAKESPTFSMILQNPTAYTGEMVIWGGSILQTLNTNQGTEILVLEIPLGYGEEPEAERYSEGRFIAKSSTYLDPEVYKEGRKITVGGEVIGKEVKPLGNAQYTYPVVRIKEAYVWSRYRYYAYPYPYFSYGPGWEFPFDYSYWPDHDWDELNDW